VVPKPPTNRDVTKKARDNAMRSRENCLNPIFDEKHLFQRWFFARIARGDWV